MLLTVKEDPGWICWMMISKTLLNCALVGGNLMVLIGFLNYADIKRFNMVIWATTNPGSVFCRNSIRRLWSRAWIPLSLRFRSSLAMEFFGKGMSCRPPPGTKLCLPNEIAPTPRVDRPRLWPGLNKQLLTFGFEIKLTLGCILLLLHYSRGHDHEHLLQIWLAESLVATQSDGS